MLSSAGIRHRWWGAVREEAFSGLERSVVRNADFTTWTTATTRDGADGSLLCASPVSLASKEKGCADFF
jgi:hypothetical protein